MAFSFTNASNAPAGGTAAGGGGPTTQGPDLELIQTEGLGFLSLAGDARLRLTSKWTDLPSPTASLLSIASKKGLVAAAGPDAVHIATTEAVRAAFKTDKTGDSEVRPFEPQIKLPLPMRISQVAFTADEQFLVISAETGGGLAVYDVDALSQGSKQPAMEISTNGEPLRALLPNPSPDTAELVIAVTNNGNLLMANLKQRGLASGPNGPVLKAGVSCAAWSTRGKQLVAGLGDGTLEQMTPDGTPKAQIPKPAGLDNHHVASVAWLENNVFLVIHITTNGDPSSAFHVITRHQEKGAAPSFIFSKMSDPVDPYGAEKKPHHIILRLKDFPPNLQDVLVISSTSREAIGLLTKSTAPLTPNKPAEKITNVFTTTEFADDSKRAELPMGEDSMDTFPIGTALDLSSKDKIYKPIPTDEIDESPGPLPGLWALNNEGVLSVWWIVYNDSIRQGTTYSGMAASQGASQPATTTPSNSSAFGSPAAAAPAFGTPAAATPAFGGASALGSTKSAWGSAATGAASTAPAFAKSPFGGVAASGGTSAFGAPAFGSPSAMGGGASAPAFGQSSAIGGGMGAKASPWGTAAASPAFGQTSFGAPGSSGTGKVFGSGTSSTPAASGGFSSFANKGGFASLAGGGDSSGGSIFGSGKPSGAFASTSSEQQTSFPPAASKPAGPAFNTSSFVLGTTFKADPKTANDNEQPSASEGGSLFGSGFGLSLDKTDTAESKDSEMGVEKLAPAAEKSNIFGTAPKPSTTSSIFGAPTSSTTPQEKQNDFADAAKPNIFGDVNKDKPNPFTDAAKPSIFGTSTSKDKPNPFADAAKPSLLGAPAASPFAPKPSGETTSSIFGSKTTTTPPAKEKGLFGTSALGASTTPTTTPAPHSIFGAPTAGSGLFGGLKPATGGSSSIFGQPTRTTSSLFTSDLKAADVKVEHGTPPLPPESTSKTTFTLSESSGSSTASPYSIDDRLDPPSKHRLADFDRPFPESRPAIESPVAAEEAPLPPDPVKDRSKYNMADFKMPPGALPTAKKLEAPLPIFSTKDKVPDQPIPDSDGEEDELSEDEEGEFELGEGQEGSVPDTEGSGVDVAKDLSPPSGYTPQSSFGGPGGALFSLTPAEDPRPGGRRLFGEMSQQAPVLPQPRPPSPRSPSPVRGAIPPRVFRSDSVRSVSAPGMASQILGAGKKPPTFGTSGAARQLPGRHTPDPNVEEQRKSQNRRKLEESQMVMNQEDDWRQDLLNAPPQPTLELAEFVSNSGTRPEACLNIPAQTEAVYRDINRMVDTLGLNARHLREYILGHMGRLRAPGTPRKTKDDLGRPDEWLLCDAEDIGTILNHELLPELEQGRVKDLDGMIESCQDLCRGLARIRMKETDLKKIVMSRADPDQASALRFLPLSAEQAAQQADLRKQLTNFSKLLVEAEESLTLLRAKIATATAAAEGAGASNGRKSLSGTPGSAVPTVDAVMRTVLKMTSMVEKRSGDVDVLETQMRKLGIQPGGPNAANGAASRENSPFSTPQKPQNRLSRSVFSPGASAALASSLVSYNNGGGASPARSLGVGTPRKKLSAYSEADKEKIQERMQKRAAVIARLKASVKKAGPNVMRMTDED